MKREEFNQTIFNLCLAASIALGLPWLAEAAVEPIRFTNFGQRLLMPQDHLPSHYQFTAPEDFEGSAPTFKVCADQSRCGEAAVGARRRHGTWADVRVPIPKAEVRHLTKLVEGFGRKKFGHSRNRFQFMHRFSQKDQCRVVRMAQPSQKYETSGGLIVESRSESKSLLSIECRAELSYRLKFKNFARGEGLDWPVKPRTARRAKYLLGRPLGLAMLQDSFPKRYGGRHKESRTSLVATVSETFRCDLPHGSHEQHSGFTLPEYDAQKAATSFRKSKDDPSNRQVEPFARAFVKDCYRPFLDRSLKNIRKLVTKYGSERQNSSSSMQLQLDRIQRGSGYQSPIYEVALYGQNLTADILTLESLYDLNRIRALERAQAPTSILSLLKLPGSD